MITNETNSDSIRSNSYDVIAPIFLIFTILFVCIIPYIHYLCRCCCCFSTKFKSKKAVKYQKKDKLEEIATIESRDGHLTDEQIKKSFKQDISLTRIMSKYFHIALFVITFYLILANTLSDPSNNSSFVKLNPFYYTTIGFILFIIYCEVILSYEFKYLSNLRHEKTIVEYLTDLIKTPPSITMRVEAWHNVEHVKTIIEKHSNGTQSTRTEKYTERVVDMIETKNFDFNRWQDNSLNPNTLPLDHNKVTRIKIIKLITFGDSNTSLEFESKRNEMIQSAKRRYPNSNVDFERTDDISGYKSRVASFWDKDKVKWWMKCRYFFLASFFLLTWVYRWAFNKKTQKSVFHITKEVFSM